MPLKDCIVSLPWTDIHDRKPAMDELTQIESRLSAVWDDVMELYVEITGEDLRSAAARDAIRRIDFYLPTVL